MKKKILALVLCLTMILSLLPMSVFADENIAEGNNWYIDSDACLHITGGIYTDAQNRPWADYSDQILKIVAEEGSFFTDCSSQFSECYNLVSADLSKLDASNITDVTEMFCNCYRLKKLDISCFKSDAEDNMNALAMFYSCHELSEIVFDGSMVKSNSFVFELIRDREWYNKTNGAKYGIRKSDVAMKTIEAIQALTGKVTFVKDPKDIEAWHIDDEGTLHLTGQIQNIEGCAPWEDFKEDIIKVVAEDGSSLANCVELFYQYGNIVSADLSKLDASNITDVTNMFYGCYKLEKLDISCFKSDAEGNMNASGMLADCQELSEIVFDGSMVKSYSFVRELICDREWYNKTNGAKYGIRSDVTMKTIEAIQALTGKVTFVKDPKDIEAWHIDDEGTLHLTGQIQNIEGCAPWEDFKEDIIKVVAEDGSSIANCVELFYQCKKMVSADLSKLKTTGVTSLRSMFDGCINIETININGFDTSAVTDMTSLFDACIELKKLDMASVTCESIENEIKIFRMLESSAYLSELSIDSSMAKMTRFIAILLDGTVWYNKSDGTKYDGTNATREPHAFLDMLEKMQQIGGKITLVKNYTPNEMQLDVEGNNFSVTINGFDKDTGVVIVGLYDNNKLLETKMFDISNNEPPQGSFEGNGKVRAFWWSDLETLIPVCECVEK